VSGVFTAAVVQADPEADLPWLATAYVPAPSLSALVRRCGPLPVPAVRWLAAGCAEALQSIHTAGLLHRDVKPSNVLVAPDGPRVIDFGVARAAERVQLTVTRGAAGTPAYMAPEQARDTAQASPASDVFSLGATLVFAAAGHPPYQGETVMDILVRLATEPPDLAGVPAELGALVSACLERVPRDRPGNAAILERLGSFDVASGGAGAGHSYLPDSAMALIGEYQHNPQLTAPPGTWVGDDSAPGERTDGSIARSGDATAGSHTALPGFHSVAAYRAGHEQADQENTGPGSTGPESTGQGHTGRENTGRRPSRRGRGPRLTQARGRPLALAGWAAAAVVLVAAGTALGMALRGSGTQSGGRQSPFNGGLPPPPSSSCTSPVFSRTPRLCSSQPFGDGDTVFVIHGSGFVPGTAVTVKLAGLGVSPVHQVADREGDFNYAIDQGHIFFHGAMRPGAYTVTVVATDGRTASTSFIVNPPGAGPPGGPGRSPPP
jgi:hypothetical protein